MLNPRHLISLKPDTPVEALDTGNIQYPDQIVLNGLSKLSGEDVPPRFDADEIYEGQMASTKILVPVSGVQMVTSFEYR